MQATSTRNRRQEATPEALCLLRADRPAAPVPSGRPPAKAARHGRPMALSLLLHTVGLGLWILLGASSSEPGPQSAPVRICAIQECLESSPDEVLLPPDVPLEIPPALLETPEAFLEEQDFLPPEEPLERPEEQVLAEPLDLHTLPLTVVRSRPTPRPTALVPVPAAPPLPPIARRPAQKRPPLRVARRPVPQAPAPRAKGPASPLKLRFAPNPDRYYPMTARRLGLSGAVVIELAVDAQGRVTSVKLVASSGHASLDGAALALGRAYRFAPIDGRRRVRVPVQFQLRGRSTRRG